ncbi:MAG: hypothetical protein ACLQVJ_00970 [Syntrophobacteraceae bacterium]
MKRWIMFVFNEIMKIGLRILILSYKLYYSVGLHALASLVAISLLVVEKWDAKILAISNSFVQRIGLDWSPELES